MFLVADSVGLLLIGRLLSGLSAGIFTGTATAAIVEAAEYVFGELPTFDHGEYTFLRAHAELAADSGLEATILETLKQINVQWIEIPDDYQSDRSLASLESEETVLSTVLAVQRDGQTRANPEASFVFQSRDRVLVSGNAESVESVTRLFRGD